MPRKNKRPDARRDANEPEIVQALEKAGYIVHRIGEPGDLLIWNPSSLSWHVQEVKTPGGRLTPKQKQYREDHPRVDIPIVETAEQSLGEAFIR